MKVMDERYLINISLDDMISEMLDCIRKDICCHTYYWYHEDKGYIEIVECDMFSHKITMADGDFSYFDWEMAESSIYREAI